MSCLLTYLTLIRLDIKVRDTFFFMNPNGAPSLDGYGYGAFFFQQSWNIVSQDVFN